ncbi:hypothetical protein AZI86_17020 [Bdellovibrio bacteriovorus]|uniref:Uncharacterized protein n=1 Tax=Bdellovibrio bacteriovorus TaxID=959 RepID=A0A150WES3_BDEBC|nr:hypothetical protein [Bdellovibrio bacteriovorus]KYG61415.1 hypothetical protein AZI86_17020 [Bdellovibrio bacteriovorus]
MSSSQSRRAFLKNSGIVMAGVSLSPHQALANALIKNLFRSAQAEAADLVSPRYYVNIYFDNGPARFTFDHWLRTNANDPQLNFNPSTGTAFTYDGSRNVTGTEYRTFDYNGVLVPHIFQTFSPSERQSFLDSFLVIRGYGSGMDGHDLNAALQMHPLSSAPSLSALLADHSDRYFQAVQYRNRGANSRFYSQKSLVMNKLTSPTQPLSELLQAIKPSTDNARAIRNANQSLFSDVRALLNSLPDDRKSVQIARKNVNTTYQLLQSNLGDFSSQWSSLVADYTAVIQAAMRSTSVPGINGTLDGSQILTSVSDGQRTKFGVGTSPGTDVIIGSGKNFLDVSRNMSSSSLAESFALAEYSIRNGLVGALELIAGPATQLLQDPATSNVADASNWFTMDGDMHMTQSYGMMYLTSQYYRGVISALLLLRTRLMAAGKWNQTVIQMYSEFDRTVGAPGAGSGHGFDQMVSSIFSGVFSGGPYVVGNTTTKAPKGGVGSQGLGAPIENYPQKGIPSPLAMASTLSALMDVPENPWKSFALPLVNLQSDGTLSLPYGKGKLIAE